MTALTAGTPLPPPRPPDPPLWPRTAWTRSPSAACERGTVGCSIEHSHETDWSCEPW